MFIVEQNSVIHRGDRLLDVRSTALGNCRQLARQRFLPLLALQTVPLLAQGIEDHGGHTLPSPLRKFTGKIMDFTILDV